MAELNCYAYLATSPLQSTPGACGNFPSPSGYLPIPDYRDVTTEVYQNRPGFSGSREIKNLSLHDTPDSSSFFNWANVEPLSNRCLIPAGPCPRPNTIDELAAELQRGVEIEAAILEHEGYQCLRRPEYQFQDSETISTPLSSQGFDLSPYDTSPPPSTESPDSVLSQDGPPVFSQTPTAGESTDFSHTSSLKRFKCSHPDCPHAASRQDHVRDHYRVHHQGIYYECDKCNGKWGYKGDFASHSCDKDKKIQCQICGTILNNKKGLNRHHQTEKCKKFHQMTHAIAC